MPNSNRVQSIRVQYGYRDHYGVECYTNGYGEDLTEAQARIMARLDGHVMIVRHVMIARDVSAS